MTGALVAARRETARETADYQAVRISGRAGEKTRETGRETQRRAKVPPPRFDLVPASRLLALRGDVTEHPDGVVDAWEWANPLKIAPAVIAVDVGADSAIALITDDFAYVRPFRFPRLDAGGVIELQAATRAILGLYAGPALVLVEDSFAGAPGRANPATKAGLDRRIGALVIWLGLARPVVRIRASQWQGPILGKAKRDAGKQRSIEVARARFPHLAIGSADESDSLLLALFGRRGRMPKGKVGA